MPKELIDLTVTLHHETDKAILISDTGDKNDAVWVPKSQCEYEIIKGNIVLVTMSIWMATEKELV